MVLGRFSATCRTLVATSQAQPRSDGKRPVVFGGALSQNHVSRVFFATLEIDKFDPKIDTKIDAEKVSKNDGTILRKWSQNEGELDKTIQLCAKGWFCENYTPNTVKLYLLRLWCSKSKNKSLSDVRGCFSDVTGPLGPKILENLLNRLPIISNRLPTSQIDYH